MKMHSILSSDEKRINSPTNFTLSKRVLVAAALLAGKISSVAAKNLEWENHPPRFCKTTTPYGQIDTQKLIISGYLVATVVATFLLFAACGKLKKPS